MKPVDLTYKVLAYKALNAGTSEEWIDWAEEMICAGYDTEHLIILAGERAPFNAFEMDRLTDKVLNELHLEYHDQKTVLYNYIYSLLDKVLQKVYSIDHVLSLIYDLGDNNNTWDLWDEPFHDFYLLYLAKKELEDLGVQLYWPNGNKENMDDVIMEYFLDWKRKYDLSME